jgi:hypothetical protein
MKLADLLRQLGETSCSASFFKQATIGTKQGFVVFDFRLPDYRE